MKCIKVNNVPHSLESSTKSISDLLDKLGQTKQGIAIAINNEVISKDKWGKTFFKDHDQILIIQAAQGG